MRAYLGDIFGGLQTLKLRAFSAGLRLRSPVETEMALRGLHAIASSFPFLDDTKYDEEEKSFTLMKRTSAMETQCMVKLDANRDVDFAWGIDSGITLTEHARKLWDILQAEWKMPGVNIEFIDLRFYCYADWDGHHPQIISRSVFSDSVVNGLFPSASELSQVVRLRGLVGPHRVAVISIETDVRDQEVRTNEFEDDRLKVTLGIAQRSGIPANADLWSLFRDHSQVCAEFAKGPFYRTIVKPLDESLTSAMANG